MQRLKGNVVIVFTVYSCLTLEHPFFLRMKHFEPSKFISNRLSTYTVVL